MKMTNHKKTGLLTAGAFTFLLLAGCDVVNPGPVQDEFLAEEASQPGLINGSVRRLAEALSYGNYTMAILSREVFPGGQIGAFGHDVAVQGGHVQPGYDVGRWNQTQQARFIAETAIKRFTEVNASNANMYRAHLYAAFAYRTLGEWWCDAVIGDTDPDVTTPGSFEAGTTTYFNRAVTNFTAALGFASNDAERHAALAGRASAYLWLGSFALAQADAAGVPDSFVLTITFDAQEQAYYNSIQWANAKTPYLSYSLENTWQKSYYDATGDPRTRWVVDAGFPFAVGSLSGFGQVPWSNQTKFTDRGDDARIASGWEMRLVEAEAILASGGSFATALGLINQVRTRFNSTLPGNAPLTAYTAADATEAWQWLKQERGLELWLEGRRLGDERRWMATNAPGALYQPPVAWETLSPLFTSNPRSYCLDIPDSERDRNPNVPPTT
ncbi:MAG: RagB/SusD family nutrient uptake outer membrane protein [Gemmatimonadetes bacterium]|nr:RagB/SusD family nutrient uptake outer membrane protein [Gemmatimonadota bacterium]MDA1104306.1 RagB/SusD family nutrient uptake outer membrane protein [Gemmatimonadota bacterium]